MFRTGSKSALLLKKLMYEKFKKKIKICFEYINKKRIEWFPEKNIPGIQPYKNPFGIPKDSSFWLILDVMILIFILVFIWDVWR